MIVDTPAPRADLDAEARYYATAELSRRPGFLIRRLHQIHAAYFAEECGGFETTPLQSSVLTIAARQPGLEQSRLAEAVGVDRTTLADVIARLETRGLIQRARHAQDRRLKLVSLTARGRELLGQMAEAAGRAHARTLEPLAPRKRAAFLAGLIGLVEAHDATVSGDGR